MNPVRWVRRSDGSLAAETTIAGVTIAGVMSAEELAQERAELPAEIGFKISLKSLGKALKSVASPGAVLKLAQNVSSVVDKVPGIKAALAATGPYGMAVMGGLAAVKALAKAKAGDPSAKAIVEKAEAIAQLPAAQRAALAPPTTPEGEIIRYLVSLQRLDR